MSLANTCAAVWLVVRRLPEQKDCSALWMCVSLWAAACRASIVWLCLFDTPQIDAVHSDAPEKKKKKTATVSTLRSARPGSCLIQSDLFRFWWGLWTPRCMKRKQNRQRLFKKCRRRRGREREDRCVESQRIDSTAAEGKTRRGTARRGDKTERWELWGEGEFKMECFFIFFFPKMEKKYMRMQVWKQAADEGRSGELEKGTQCSDWREMRPYGKSTIDRKWLERKRSWWKNVS